MRAHARAARFGAALLWLVLLGLPVSALAVEAPPPPDTEDEGVGEIEAPEAAADGARVYRLDDTVVTTTRRRTERLATTIPVDVLSRESLDELLPVALGDVLSAAPGLSTVKPSGGYFQNPSIRGLGGRRVVILVDGRRIDTEKTMGVTGYFVDLASVQRVEIVRGPGSVLYGSDAIGGVINIITVDPLSRDGVSAGYRLTTDTNSGLLSNALRVGWSSERFALEITGRYREAGDYETGDGERIETSGYSDGTVGLKLAWRPSEHHVLRLNGDGFFGMNLGKAANELDDEKRRRILFPHDRHAMARLAYEGSGLSRLVEAVSIDAWFDLTDRLQRVRFWNDLEVQPNHLTSVVEKQGDFRMLGGTGTVSLGPAEGNALTIGVDGSYKLMDQVQRSHAVIGGDVKAPIEVSLMDGTSMWSVGAFAQDEHRFGRRWRLLAGLRWDGHGGRHEAEGEEPTTSFDNAVSGNLGLLFHPTPSMALSLNLGRAFRAPTAKEKFLTIDSCKGRLRGSTDVVPEHSTNVDLGWKGVWGPLTYELYAFSVLIEDFISLAAADEVATYDYTNIGLAWLVGGETRLALDFPRLLGPVGLRIAGALSYVRGEDLETGDPLAQIPPLGVRSSVRFYGTQPPGLRSFYLEASLRCAAAQDRVSPAGSVSADTEATTGAYLTADVGLGMRFAAGSLGLSPGLFVRVENLADTGYRDHLSSVAAMGRTVRIGFSLDYD